MSAHRARIRRMSVDDLEEVLRIIRLHDSDDYRAAKQVFNELDFDALGDDDYVVCEALDEGRVVGVTGHYPDDLEAEGIHWLGWTYVNPYAQGRGYGSMLLKHVIDALRRRGVRKLYLSTSSLEKFAKAVRFYERHGFVIEGVLKDYYQDGEDQIMMALRLNKG